MAGFGNNLPMMQMQMQQLEQQRMMLQQQMQSMNGMQQMPMQQGIKGRPVSSLDEVKGAMIDFDGSVSFFPSIANGKIYTKQIGLDGNPVYTTYTKQNEIDITDNVINVSQNDFRTAMENINQRFDYIYELLGGAKNVSIRTNDANVQRQKSATNNVKSDDAAISK